MNIRKLIENLTIEEKIGQLQQLPPSFFNPKTEVEVFGQIRDLNITKQDIYRAGSVLGIGSAEEMIAIQKHYLENSTHKIPLMFMADIIHGYKTIFPVPLAIAASWNPGLAEEAAHIQAIESRVSGVHVTFSPMVDVTRDPRWGRVVEGFGEDPYLASEFARAIVKGYQGDDISKMDRIASCAKHFAAYGASESGKDYNTADISHITLFNTYLPPYQAAIDAKVKMIMTAFNTIDNIPATINKFLLKDILRKQWRFKGVVISDYDSLQQTIAHGVSKNEEDAAKKGINAGLDIEMASTCYMTYLQELIKNNKVAEKTLDDAVYRILKLKSELGLFNNPYQGADIIKQKQLVKQKAHMELSLKLAEESAVLLKNNAVLPLNHELTYAILGPYANTKNTNGPWSGHGTNNDNTTLLENLLEKHIKINICKDSILPIYNKNDLQIIRKSDQIILVLGEDESESGEAHSKASIDLPRQQEEFLKFVKQLNKKAIILLQHGRPFVLKNIMDADAIVDTFFLGSCGNEAIANILTGKVNPSGKLPITYPRSIGQIPIYYNHLNTGRPQFGNVPNSFSSYYLDELNEPLFPFGYGLSYSKITYGNINIDKALMSANDSLTVNIDITNESDISCLETVQLYIRALSAEIARPIKELKAFKKIVIAPHQKVSVYFILTKKHLSYYDINGNEKIDSGNFEVMIGSNSKDLEKANFYLNN